MTKQPFIHQIRVGWADCDPAQIAYTGRLPNFALEAIDAWWETHVGDDWYRLNLDRNVGTPFVHLDLDFHSPVTPRHPLLCEVQLKKLGESSISFHVIGRQNGVDCFSGNFVNVFVVADEFVKRKAPEDIRSIVGPLIVG
ncbi:acyl-CoA thioesterase [Sneathiella sp. P13V-1]|uniref:acyl-CoA thioesterase n=1 Tax=Sneathiella sp. P13V-1 TaxID=2697366 RepID=UPI00187B53CB|nr:thioesterase family protein [Sneathiella sp. P13V-1]MBE7637462.1 acyl-CoA thioesterase [Sneathiella sp. P13V-1]